MKIDDFNRMAEAANDIRLDTEFMRLSRGAENQLEGDVESARAFNKAEAEAINGEGWNPEDAIHAYEGLYQHQVLPHIINRANELGADAVVFLIWDGVNYRQAKIVNDYYLDGHELQTHLEPVVVRPPAMTAWGHYRLLHGTETYAGLARALRCGGAYSWHTPLAAWGFANGILDEDTIKDDDWQATVREQLAEQTSALLSAFVRPGFVYGYTGVNVPPIAEHTIPTFNQAMVMSGAEQTKAGSRGEAQQAREIQQFLRKSADYDGAFLLSRYSLDSKKTQNHNAIIGSGHVQGPFHDQLIHHIAEVWQRTVRLIQENSPFTRTLLVATSDHGMTNTFDDLRDPESNGTMPSSGFMRQKHKMSKPGEDNAGTPWFSNRGIFVNSVDDYESVRDRVHQNNGKMFKQVGDLMPRCTPIHDGLFFSSLEHGFSMDKQLGDHGGDGFDDLIVPYMEKLIEKEEA